MAEIGDGLAFAPELKAFDGVRLDPSAVAA